jgi:biopolymer transport protein ExbD
MPIKTHLDEQPSLNLTPMIDVVFLLIIFFMAGTKFTELERKIGLQVPRVSNVSTLTPAPERRVINVYRDGRISLDREFLALEQLQERLQAARAEYSELGVIVRGDAEGTFQSVANVLSACREAGIEEMGISVRLAQAGESSSIR